MHKIRQEFDDNIAERNSFNPLYKSKHEPLSLSKQSLFFYGLTTSSSPPPPPPGGRAVQLRLRSGGKTTAKTPATMDTIIKHVLTGRSGAGRRASTPVSHTSVQTGLNVGVAGGMTLWVARMETFPVDG